MTNEEFDTAQAVLGDRVICSRCGCTFATYGFETCTARLDERCPGFDAVEGALNGDPS